MPYRPRMMPPVGKSGPGRRYEFFGRGLWIVDQRNTASITSPRLCGGMFVAMPTAMPPAPLTSRFGNRPAEPAAPAPSVVVVLEVDRVLVEVVEQRCASSPCALGVAHGRGHIAVHRAEIALAVDQRVAQGEFLRHADHRVIDRLVAVRMVLTEHVADEARRLAVGRLQTNPARTWDTGCADAPASVRRAHPAAREPRSRSWRNRDRTAHLVEDGYGANIGGRRRLGAARFQGQTKGKSGQFRLKII